MDSLERLEIQGYEAKGYQVRLKLVVFAKHSFEFARGVAILRQVEELNDNRLQKIDRKE